MYILGIESSCDDSAIAIIDHNKNIIVNLVSSQIKEHIPYGGVVPELAARKHSENLPKLLKLALSKANITISQIDLICATAGPGLIGGVVVGLTMAKTLAQFLDKPFIAVNHLVGHALCPRIENEIELPYLLLLVSGGHSQILIVEDIDKFTLLGETLDDAFGEAFDKVAKMLKLPYPGGPNIEKKAKLGDSNKFKMPLPLAGKADYNFSLSGLKTHVRTLISNHNIDDEQFKADLSASFQKTIAKHLADKLEKSLIYFQSKFPQNKNIVFSGGVAANEFLRNHLSSLASKYKFNFYVSAKNLCTDNATMIAWAGYEEFKKNGASDINFRARSRWPLTS